MPISLKDESSVIGRTAKDLKKYGEKGTAYLGKTVLSAGDNPTLGRKVLVDISKPHLVLICGKRGGGKSYSTSVIMEEFCLQPAEIRQRMSIITIDTVGIFWTLKEPNEEEKKLLADSEWMLEPQGMKNVRVLVPKGKLSFYKEKGLPVDGAFSLNISELNVTEWMALFQLNWSDPEAVLITKVIEKLQEEKKTGYGFEEIVKEIKADSESQDLTKKALANRFKVAESWGLFEKYGTPIKEIATPGMLSIIDVSSYSQSIGTEGTRDIVVAMLGKKLFEERMLYRKEEEINLIKGKQRTSEMPIVWMLIDEAHMFMPKDRESIALKVLLEWVRVGRQPGLSLLLATQIPNKLHPDAISQCDLFISHRMTAQPDIQAVSQLRPSYLHQNFDKYYEEMPKEKGYALILDDNTERIWMIRIRPRLTWDGGKTASVFKE